MYSCVRENTRIPECLNELLISFVDVRLLLGNVYVLKKKNGTTISTCVTRVTVKPNKTTVQIQWQKNNRKKTLPLKAINSKCLILNHTSRDLKARFVFYRKY